MMKINQNGKMGLFNDIISDEVELERQASAKALISTIKNKAATLGLHRDWKPLPLGIPIIDNHVIGIGGWPGGGITELAGPSGSAKSALLYQSIGQLQKAGKQAALLQPEDAFDSEWAAKFGIDETTIFSGDFSTTEEAFGLIIEYISKGVDFIAVDSLARLLPESVFERALAGKEQQPGVQAKVLRVFLGIILNGYRKKDIPRLRDTETVLLFINHTTQAIGERFPKYITTGGTAVQYDPHLRLSTWHRGWSEEKDGFGHPLKQLIRVRQEKSRLQWGPKGYADIWLDAGGNFEEADDGGFLVDMAVVKNFVEVRGAWIIAKKDFGVGKKKWQGREAFKDFCNSNPEIKGQVITAKKDAGKQRFGV